MIGVTDGLHLPPAVVGIRPTPLDRGVAWAVQFVAITAPLESAVDFDDLLRIGSVPIVTPAKLAGIVLFPIFLAWALTHRRALWFGRIHVVTALIIALAACSALHARSQTAGLAATIRYTSFVAVFMIVTEVVRDETAQLRTIWSLVAACGLAAALSLGNMLSGHASLATTFYGDANDEAFVLACALPLAFWLLSIDHRRRLWILGLIALVIVSVILSLSRGAILGLAAAAFWELVVERRHRRALLTASLLAASAIVAIVLISPHQIQAGLAGKQRKAWSNVTNRVAAWRTAVELMHEHPWLGVGPGNFESYYAERAEPGAERLRVVHNTYLDIGAEVGLAAAGLFGAYLWFTFACLSAIARRATRLSELAKALRTSLVVATVASLFLTTQFAAPFWLLGGLAHALARISDRPRL